MKTVDKSMHIYTSYSILFIIKAGVDYAMFGFYMLLCCP